MIYNYTKIVLRDLRVGIMVSNLRTARFPQGKFDYIKDLEPISSPLNLVSMWSNFLRENSDHVENS
jgi:hypothetical protein